MVSMTEAKNPVKAVETTIEIIEVVKSMNGAGIAEITEQVDVSQGTVHNHLSTLCQHDLATHRDGNYYPGLRFFEIGEHTRNQLKVYELAVPEVDKLAEQTGELASLLVEEHGRGIYLYRSWGNQALQLDTQIGSRVPLHTTGLGKSILAYLPKRRVNEIIDNNGLTGLTDNTITEKGTLFEELDTIQEEGVAIDREERTAGVVCVAAPIQTNDGKVLGSVSVAGPISRMKGNVLESEISELVRNAARVVGINATHA